MKSSQKVLLKRNINVRLQRLEKILGPTEQAVSPDSLAVSDKEERIDAINETAMDEALVNIARHEKTRLLANADWLETGEAGLCQSCGREIPIQRMLTVPTTRCCIQCAAKQET